MLNVSLHFRYDTRDDRLLKEDIKRLMGTISEKEPNG
jgi:hypothetical protein